MTDYLTLNLLGNVTILLNGQPLTSLPSRTAEALLIYVACQDRPVAREALADLLWDDRPQEQAQANLRSLLSALRRAVGDHLLITRQDVAFNFQSPHEIDARRFEALPRDWETRMPAFPLTENDLSQLQTAAALYQGDFLAHFTIRDGREFEAWLLVTRERLRRLAVQAWQMLVRHFLLVGDYQAGIPYATRLADLDPYSEEAHRHLMQLLARAGQRHAALQQYQKCRQLLADDLGVLPLAETTAFYERLRRAGAIGRHNLPPAPTPFVGRTAERAALRRHLADPDCRLLTILGPGGIGKTRLALQTAQDIIQQRPGMFLDGIWYVPLAALSSARLLSATIADALGLELSGQAPPDTQLTQQLRERELLLILDNMEHLLAEEEGAALLAHLLHHAPDVKLLVTSRERLNLREEWVHDAPGLAYPPADVSPEGAVDFSAVRLFWQQARQLRRDFTPTEEDWRAMAQVCRHLEGMPLGIELAAAWVRQFTCPEIAAHVAASLDFLSTPYRNLPARHRSLQAVFTHTCALLRDTERATFYRLAIFAASFTSAAAETVAAATPTLLADLADKSLLRRTAAGRWELHTLLRHYAGIELNRDPTAQFQVAARHSRCYAAFLRQREPLLNTPDEKTHIAAIDAEIDNIRAAWTWALAQRQLADVGDMLHALFYLYDRHSLYQPGWQMLAEAAAHLDTFPPGPDRDMQRARLLTRWARFDQRLGQYDDARRRLQTSVTILRAANRPRELALALAYLGEGERLQNNAVAAIPYLRESLALAQAAQDQQKETLARLYWGNACIQAGRYHEARQLYEAGLAGGAYAGSPRQLAVYLDNLGTVARELGDMAAATEQFQAAMRIREAQQDRWGMAISANNLAVAASDAGNQADAMRLYERAVSLFRDMGHRAGLAQSLSNLGEVAVLMDELARAGEVLAESARIWREMGHAMGNAHALFWLGRVALLRGLDAEAEAELRQALSLYRTLDSQMDTVLALRYLGQTMIRQGDLAAARRYLREALQLTQAGEQARLKMETLVTWAELSWREGKVDLAAGLLAYVRENAGSSQAVQKEAAALAARLSPTPTPRTFADEADLLQQLT
ncbi:MAG: tetratricopeptide repeat protein [Ardenticatenales bacterium]|nr:tetratricopeptide repeat protein [Ardenticatenales bacterium]